MDTEENNTIRRIIKNIHINTDTAYCFHKTINLVSELSSGSLAHRKMVQGLYQNADGHYFIAFWNKPTWNAETLGYDYIDDVVFITQEQAKQWVMNYCPGKFSMDNKIWEQDKNPASMQTVSIRMTTELRNHLKFLSKVSGQSVNKLCIDLMDDGMSVRSTRASVPLPPTNLITMPDGRVVLDSFEKALQFDVPEDQKLANYAEALYGVWRFHYPLLFVFVARTLYKIITVEKNKEHALCFSEWVSKFYRSGHYDNNSDTCVWDDSQQPKNGLDGMFRR